MSRVRSTQDIRPLADFRANLASVVRQVQRTKRPVILTQHGRSAAVLVDAGEYEALVDRAELLDDVRVAESEIAQGKGWRETGLKSYSVDASFAVSDKWKLTGYASQSHQDLKINHGTGYQADLKTRSDGFGVGFAGNPTPQLEIGAQLTYLLDNTRHGLAASPSKSNSSVPPT